MQIITILVTTMLGCKPRPQAQSAGKLVGGTTVKEALPFMAEIGFDDSEERRGFCGGTLIENNIVLTAAHCVFSESKRLRVTIGETESLNDPKSKVTSYPVIAVIIHPLYDSTNFKNDIAILVLDQHWLI